MAQHSSQYLESKVLTAPPQRLHLMLIEGAIRFGRQAEAELNASHQTAAAGPLLRVLDIVGELLAGIRQTKSDLNDKLAAVYWYIFRRVSEATMNSDKEALAEVLKLLEFERETWQKVCEKFGSSSIPTSMVPAPSHAFGASQSSATMSGLSLEA
jgi:flagellar secretion chaperone FliS